MNYVDHKLRLLWLRLGGNRSGQSVRTFSLHSSGMCVRLRNVSNGVGFIRRKLRRITRWTPRDSWRQIAATLAVIFWELSTLSQFATKSLSP